MGNLPAFSQSLAYLRLNAFSFYNNSLCLILCYCAANQYTWQCYLCIRRGRRNWNKNIY